MQIERYELTLEIDDQDKRIFHSPARGALLHGLLMREVGSSNIHSNANAPRAFSQYLQRRSDGRQIWTINLLHDSATPIKEWLHSLKAHVEKERDDSSNALNLYIEHYDSSITVSNVELTERLSYQDLFASSISDLPPKFVSFDFLTPLVFKKAGQESPHPFPEARLIVQSALSRWNAFSDCATLGEPEILDELNRYASIFSFNLRSQHVAMDKIDFAGSTGSISYVIHRAELRQIFDLCGRYAEFCGLGAKTAMGLGAVKYTAQELRHASRRRAVHTDQSALT